MGQRLTSLHCQIVATLEPPGLEDGPPTLSFHPLPKPVHALATPHLGLPRSLRHTNTSLFRFTACHYTPFPRSLQIRGAVGNCMRLMACVIGLSLACQSGGILPNLLVGASLKEETRSESAPRRCQRRFRRAAGGIGGAAPPAMFSCAANTPRPEASPSPPGFLPALFA